MHVWHFRPAAWPLDCQTLIPVGSQTLRSALAALTTDAISGANPRQNPTLVNSPVMIWQKRHDTKPIMHHRCTEPGGSTLIGSSGSSLSAADECVAEWTARQLGAQTGAG